MVTVELMIVYLYLVCVVGSWLVVLAVYLFWVVCVCFKFGLLFVCACVGAKASLSGVLLLVYWFIMVTLCFCFGGQWFVGGCCCGLLY